MAINKENIMMRLKAEKICISSEELDEGIGVYKLILHQQEMLLVRHYSHIFKITNNKINLAFWDILKFLIIFKKKDLLKYMDSIFIENNIRANSLLNPANFMASLKRILQEYEENKENYIYYMFMKDPNRVENFVSKDSYYLYISNYIDDDYCDIIHKFEVIFQKIDNSDDKVYTSYSRVYVNLIYYYFLDNEVITKDLDRAKKFLDSIKNDPIGTVDRLSLYRFTVSDNFDDIKKMFDYIDDAYKTFDTKVKVIE